MIKPPLKLPTAQQLAWLLVRPICFLEETDQQLLSHLCQDPVIDQVYELAKDFGTMIRQRRVELLDGWLANCQSCPAVLMNRFGLRLHRNADAARLRGCASSPGH